MAIALGRALYTQRKRSHNNFPFSTASTALPPSYTDGANVHGDCASSDLDGQDISTCHTKKEALAVATAHEEVEGQPVAIDAIAILPQHITKNLTTLIMREKFPPLVHGAFTVTTADGKEVFKVDRECPSLSRRRHLVDSQTGARLLTVRRDVGSLPRSFFLEDPEENKVLELQGKFYVPFQGPRSSASFINFVNGQKIDLFMQGSWLNRNVEIVEKESGRVVATAQREIFTVRNAVGGRTSYNVRVQPGVDLLVVTGLIMALDARAD